MQAIKFEAVACCESPMASKETLRLMEQVLENWANSLSSSDRVALATWLQYFDTGETEEIQTLMDAARVEGDNIITRYLDKRREIENGIGATVWLETTIAEVDDDGSLIWPDEY